MAKASDEQLTTRPSRNRRSIGEILAHLAEDEIVTAWRHRQMVEHTGIQMAGFDQDLWARMGDYASRVPHESLAVACKNSINQAPIRRLLAAGTP